MEESYNYLQAKSYFNSISSITVKNETEFRKRYREISALGEGSQSKIYLCEDRETYGICAFKLFKSVKREHAIREYKISKYLLEKHSMRNVVDNNNEMRLENINYSQNTGNQIENDNIVANISAEQGHIVEDKDDNIFGTYLEDVALYEIREKLGFFQDAGDMDLWTYITKKGIANSQQRNSLMRQLIRTLKYVHRYNILHRDIKLENILVTIKENEQLDAKVIDFGLAASLEFDSEIELRRCCGSHRYQAPEILPREKDKYSPMVHTKAVDIFSLGVVFYALHFVAYPFKECKYRSVKVNKYTENILSEEQIEDSKSLGFDAEVLRLTKDMLRLNPELRPSIEEVERRFEEALKN